MTDRKVQVTIKGGEYHVTTELYVTEHELILIRHLKNQVEEARDNEYQPTFDVVDIPGETE